MVKKINEQSDIKRCARCVTPKNYPGVKFDSEGVCLHCRAYDNRFKGRRKRKSEFVSIVKKQKKRNSKYSAVIGISGGKDSCYVLHAMVKEFGFNDVLSFTDDNGFLADGAKQNIDKIVTKLGVDHIYHRKDEGYEKRLYQALVKNKCSDFCIFCGAGLASKQIDIALKENIATVVTGLSPRTEPMWPFEIMNALDFRYLRDVVKPYIKKRELHGFKNISLPRVAYATFIKRLQFINLPEYMEWDEKKIIEELEKEYDWTDYGKGAPHFDCLANPAIDYFTYKRLGVSKNVEIQSVLIRAGKLTREEALRKLAKIDFEKKPLKSLETICQRMDITMEDLKPYFEGRALTYKYFKSNVNLLRKVRFFFWVLYKLGFTSELIYEKYSK